ncbi:hypothetical protein JCM19233_7180 [Vibrio astriarenae]|nr:hypothetical protein JCM19233_7180 [Vibrio sp. C7]
MAIKQISTEHIAELRITNVALSTMSILLSMKKGDLTN